MDQANNKTAAAQISVIVPVYKVEPYLRCCIDSILAQTFTNFELILVDDGSPDNCGAICDEYAAKDKRITVIHQKNGGLSAARNAAIDWCFANSKTEWITFVDSDDAIVPSCLETMYRYAEKTSADTVIAQEYDFSNDEEIRSITEEVKSVKTIPGKKASAGVYQRMSGVSFYAWGKLYRKSLLQGMRYPVGKQFEDEDLTPKLLYKSMMVTVLDAHLYCYRMREDSIVHVPFSLRRFDHLEGMDSCILFFKEKNEDELVRLAEKRKKEYVAKYVLLAHGAKLTDSIPQEYRMPAWRASIILTMTTLRRGGIKHILVRVRQFFKRIQRTDT